MVFPSEGILRKRTEMRMRELLIMMNDEWWINGRDKWLMIIWSIIINFISWLLIEYKYARCNYSSSSGSKMHYFIHQCNFTLFSFSFHFSFIIPIHPTTKFIFRILFYLTGIRTQGEKQTVFSPSSQKWRVFSRRWQTNCELYIGTCQRDYLLVFRQRPISCVLCIVRIMRIFWQMDRSW